MNMLSALENISVVEAVLLGTTGYALIFVGLIALMVVIKLFTKKAPKKTEAAPAPQAAAQADVTVEEIPVPTAPGSAGKLKLYDTPPKTAAMLMAIVANQMGKPLNELRFISIKEVK